MTARKMASNLDANGKKIQNLPAPVDPTDATPKSYVDTAETNAKSRSLHTGTQLANTISNFDAAVRTNRLDQMTAPTTPVGFNAQKITGVADPVAAQDAATKNYVDNQITGLTTGQTLKGVVRAVVSTNVNITSPGTTLDGLTAATGNIFYLNAQTDGKQNGPYQWNGAATPMTRPTNWDTTAEAVVGSYWIVTSGSSQDTIILLTNDSYVLGTTAAASKIIDVAAAAAPPFEADMGDGSATSFVLTHSLNTRAVSVAVWRNAAPYDEIDVSIERTSVNTVTIAPDEVWSTNQYHVVIAKF